MIQNRAFAVVLAAIIVTSMVAPFAAVGGAAAAPAGMATIPASNIADDAPAGADLSLTASELDGGVMASQHADSLEVVLTTADHAPSVMDSDSATVSGDGMAVVLRDDQHSAGREVAIDAGLLQQALGYRPEAIYGTHEDGSEWTRSAEYVDGYLVFEVPHFSSNTVTFSGEVTIDATGATNATQFEYETSQNASITNQSLTFTGVKNTNWANVSRSNVGDGGSIPLSIGGNMEPSGPSPNGEPTVTVTGKKEINTVTTSGGTSGSKTVNINPGGTQTIQNAEIELRPGTSSARKWLGSDEYTLGATESISNNIETVTAVDLHVKSVECCYDGTVTISGPNGDIGTSPPDYGYIDEVYTYNTNFAGGASNGGSTDITIDVNTGQSVIIEDITLIGEESTSQTVNVDNGGSQTYSLSSSATKSIDIDRGTSSVDISTNKGSLGYTISYDETYQTDSPTVSVGGETYSYSGTMSDGETAVYEATGISRSANSISVSTNSGSVDVSAKIKEQSITRGPKLTIETPDGSQTIDYTGELPDGQTVDLSESIDPSLLGGATTATVGVDEATSGPAAAVSLNYSHTAQDKISTTYEGTVFEERYNISHTYASETENAKATIPFKSSQVVGVKKAQYRVGRESWTDVSAENYRFDGTVLDVYLDSATGGVKAGQTVDIRATGRKVSVDGGSVTVTDPTKPGEDLDTQLRIDERTPDFSVNVGPTEDGDRVHYAYSNEFPTEDYVVIQDNGDQDLHLPNAVTGDRFRVRQLDTRVVAERGDVRIDVVKAGENPELDVSPGPGGDGDPVTVEYYNTETGVTYLLNSLTRSIVVDSDVAESPAIFEDDDSEDTWAILRDSGTATTSGGGGGGIMPTQVSSAASSVSLPLGDSIPTPLIIVGVLGLGAVVVFRRFNPFGGSSTTSSRSSRSSTRGRSSGSGGSDIPGLGAIVGVFGSIRSLLSAIPFSRVVGVVWDTLFGIAASAARVLWNALRGAGGWLAASTASSARSAGGWVAARLATPAIALGVVAFGVMAAVQAGIISPPQEVRLMLAAVSALIGSAIALRSVGLLNWRFYGIVAGSTFVIIAETLSPGSVLDALGSGLEQTFPIFGLVIAYLVYRRVRGGGGSDDSGTTVVVTGNSGSDSSSQSDSGGD